MYNKKLLQQITGSLDKAKAPKKPNDIIVDPKGQWDHPGEITRIPSNQITMQGVDYPVYGVPNVGEPQMMMPGAEYMFPGADYVDEYPQMAEGGESTCPEGYVWSGEECIKNWIPQKKSSKQSVIKKQTDNKEIKDLMDYGKKTLPNKKPSYKPIKNLLVQSKDIVVPKDDLLENITEFFDPSGYFSWDDAEKAKKEWQTSDNILPTFNQSMDIFGAVPILGKLGKLKYLASAPDAMKALYKYFPWQQAVNAIDTGQDINHDNLDYKRGGAYTTYSRLPKNYGRSKYSSNISATNRVFARNFLFRKEKGKIYDPNAKYEQGGIPNLPLTENRRDYNLITRSFEPKYQDGGEKECPEGYAFNPKTGECVEWAPTVYNTESNPTSFDPVGDVIYMNPNDRPEGMSDEEYAQMYQDQLEHEQLHRLQWMNGELKGENKTPLRMPSTVDNQEYEGDHYYNRRGEEEDYLHKYWKNYHPNEAEFIPDDVIYNYETNPAMYQLPWTEEGEAREYEYATHEGMQSLFPKKQDGGEAMNAMMKAKLAYANEFGNPAAKRMINLPDDPYEFDNGTTGTHYMASMDNYAVPQIQDENGQLILGDFGPESNEAIQFDRPEDAEYFAEHYKEVSPGFMELELTPEEIEEYAKGGYIIEDVSIPSLNQKQEGGVPEDGIVQRAEYAEGETPEGFAESMPIYTETTKKADAPLWLDISRQYEKKNSKQAFIDKKKRDYLKNTNKGLSKAAGLSMDNFPEDVEKNFANEYDYKKNTYVGKKLGREKGFNVKRRGQWVDELTPGEKNIIANSKFESKLQPSYLSRSLAGLQELGNTLLPGQPLKYDIPGLTKKEQKEIAESKLGALETLAPLDIPGAVIANAINRTGNLSTGAGYRESPSVLSGEKMAGVTDLQATVLNPFTYTAGYDIPMLGKALLTGARNIPKLVSKSKNVTKPAVNTVAEIAEAPTRIVAPPSIPQRPTTSAQVISNRFDELSNTYDALTARAKLIDEFGMEDVQRAFSNQYSQPSHSGSINLRRSGNNQLPPPPPEITIDPSITGTNFRQRSLEDDMQSVINEINLNVNHPEYRIEDSYDDLLNTLTTNPRYTPEDIERVRNNNRYRTVFTDLKNQQRSFADYQNAVANRNTSSSPFSSSAQEYISGSYRPSEQNINVSNRYADKINKIAAQILRPQEFLTLNNAVVGSPAKTAAKKLSKKFNTAKDLVKETLEKANINIGKLIDKSKIESLKDPIKPKDIDTEVNKLLESGLGVKKGDIKIKVNTKSNGQTQVLLQPYDFFKNNKKLIEDVYGEGTFDEWIKTIDKDAWIDSGYLGLGSTSGEMLKPRTFTEILSGKKAKPTIDFGSYGNVEIPTPGLKRAGDFPFEKWDYNFRQNILDNLGVSGEISQAYKKALQSKGYNIYSGGTGHLMPGAKRYVRELLNNRVEVMNPKAAEDLMTLLNDPNVLRDVNVSLKNKNVPLPEVVRNAINPIVFKYKKKGGQIQNYFELDLTPEEIEDYRKQGYIIEDVD